MAHYTKLWSQILESTIWQEPNDMVVLWIAILALKGPDHIVRASIPGLAKHAKISNEDCERYLERMMQPDKYSQNTDYEGRRLQRIDGGWLVLNGDKYQQLLRDEQRKAAVAKANRDYRARKRQGTRRNGDHE